MAVTQEGFRWRNDDGSETTATWLAAQDTNASLLVDDTARLRVVLDTDEAADPTAYTLYYKKTGDPTWLPVEVGAGGGDPVYVAASSNITAGGQATTAQLSAPTGKTTADFSEGGMWDDENGSDLIEIGGWTPAALTLRAWWDASDTATITASGGLASQWNDKSGLARHFTQATSTNRPGTGAVTKNSLNVLTFDGSDNYMVVDAGSDAIDLKPVTVYAVTRLISPPTGNFRGILSSRVSATGNDENAPNMILLMSNSSTYWSWCASTGLTPQIEGSNAWALVHFRFDGTTASIRVNGGTASTVNWSSQTASFNVVRYLSIGARLQSGSPPTFNTFCPLEVAEVVISADSADTDAYTYLADKWGLTVTIP